MRARFMVRSVLVVLGRGVLGGTCARNPLPYSLLVSGLFPFSGPPCHPERRSGRYGLEDQG
nr:MAG TPA: hypothetical protein [Caudoviricetes sp.]